MSETADVKPPEPVTEPLRATFAVIFNKTVLVTARAPVAAWDFALGILDFLGCDCIPMQGQSVALECLGDKALDGVLCNTVPCYTMAALLRDEAVKALKLKTSRAALA